MEGSLRGELAERISKLLPLSSCDTVYTTIRQSDLMLASFNDITGKRSKREILNYFINKSLNEATPGYILDEAEIRGISIKHKKQAVFEMFNEIVEWYWQTGGASRDGNLLETTSIPDGVLIDNNLEIAGPVEVKAYTPDLVIELIKRLPDPIAVWKTGDARVTVRRFIGNYYSDLKIGVNLYKEVEFIDFIRNVGYGLQALGEYMQMVLRFPEDSPTYQLQQYGKYIRSLGFPSVAIQVLPITSSQLTKYVIELLRSKIDQIRSAKRQVFKASEINSMERLIAKHS